MTSAKTDEARPIGLFAPSQATQGEAQAQAIERWVSEQHTLFLSLARIHTEAIAEKRRERDRAEAASSSRWKQEDRVDLDDLDEG